MIDREENASINIMELNEWHHNLNTWSKLTEEGREMGSTTTFVAALLSGGVTHLCVFIRGKWHLHVTHIVFSHCALLVFVWYLLFHLDRDLPASHA
jgi:hypothetical protein